VIKKPTSQITSSPEKAAALVKSLRQAQDDQTARMGSDTVGVLAASDPDQRFFITAPFKNMRLVQHGNGNLVTNSLAYMSPEQNGTLEDRYYNPGTPVILDKAGSGAGSSHSTLSGPGRYLPATTGPIRCWSRNVSSYTRRVRLTPLFSSMRLR
jgi:hypothetical protein